MKAIKQIFGVLGVLLFTASVSMAQIFTPPVGNNASGANFWRIASNGESKLTYANTASGMTLSQGATSSAVIGTFGAATAENRGTPYKLDANNGAITLTMSGTLTGGSNATIGLYFYDTTKYSPSLGVNGVSQSGLGLLINANSSGNNESVRFFKLGDITGGSAGDSLGNASINGTDVFAYDTVFNITLTLDMVYNGLLYIPTLSGNINGTTFTDYTYAAGYSSFNMDSIGAMLRFGTNANTAALTITSFNFSQIPEPSTIALLTLGGAGLLLALRRRK